MNPDKSHFRLFLLTWMLLIFTAVSLPAQKGRINWSPDRPLTWNDFTKTNLNKNGYSASVYWELSYRYSRENGESKFIVDCFSLKNKSWVKKGKQLPQLLAHEQLHFDLAEVYARKLRVKLNNIEYRKGRPITNPNKIFNQVFDECTKIQDRYDRETNHGTRDYKQAEWEKQIKAWLEESKI